MAMFDQSKDFATLDWIIRLAELSLPLHMSRNRHITPRIVTAKHKEVKYPRINNGLEEWEEKGNERESESFVAQIYMSSVEKCGVWCSVEKCGEYSFAVLSFRLSITFEVFVCFQQ